jgi:Family of unknown function (DUF6521)
MKVWQDRPSEVANLFNPAFSATLLGYASRGFAGERSAGLPWVLSFLVVPLILHKPTREVGPKTKVTKFQTWVEKNPTILIGFAERARHMVPHVREGIMFGVSSGLLLWKEDATLSAGSALPEKDVRVDSEEVKDCFRKAKTLGSILANAGTEHTVFALLGVRA